MNSRVNMTMRNVFWSYFSMVASLIIQFVSRTIFIYTLGETYLGVNGLFTNVLGLLSFAELGIGTAMNFALYKPVAHGDKEKIKSYMRAYKWAYRAIAVIISVIGLVLVPFLDYIVKDPGNIGDIRLYYLLFLLNTITTYFVSYKYSLVNADQKNYIQTNTHLIATFVKAIVQIVFLLLFSDYLGYLIAGIAIDILQRFFINIYLNKLYPYLKEKDVKPLEKEEKKTLITKIKALIMHKIGDVCVNQTDNIIVSSFISVTMVGLLSNYNLLITTVTTCVNILFNSVTGSLGNLVATESKERQYSIFSTYRFVAFWFYGFTAIALFTLLTPFITLWIGESMVVDEFVILLIIINYYMVGHRNCLNNFKSAAGVFERDKFVAVIQAVVNIVASIGLVYVVGLPGVYLGTIIQGTIASIIKPIVTYKPVFDKSSKFYFMDAAKYGITTIIAGVLCVAAKHFILSEITILRFILMTIIVLIIPNLFFFLIFRKTSEFHYILNTIKNKLPHKNKKKVQ
ncbi:MAG: polysaccharide biosynthesis protein [Ruminococcus sp.]|nr:polysaccharide biosynthesis protein [Ruminococcus sp.]